MPMINRSAPKALPPLDFLRANLDYDPATGVLLWKVGRRVGMPAGCPDKYGYLVLKFSSPYNGQYKVHRVIWKWMTGDEPPATVDHRDLAPRDNRWGQLRAATTQQNIWNTRTNNSPSGFRGVRRARKGGQYHARIRIDEQERFLGAFDTPEEASEAYEAARRERDGEFYRS